MNLAAHDASRLTSYDECLAVSGGDPFVRWQIDPLECAKGWVVGDAVAFESHRHDGRSTLTIVGPTPSAAAAVRALVPVVESTRVTVPRGTLELLDGEVRVGGLRVGGLRVGEVRVGEVRVGEVAQWEWMFTCVPPAAPHGDHANPVHTLGAVDYPDIRALLAVASPRHHANPGDPGVVRWVGVRDQAGTLLSCAAHTEEVAGVPFLASIATHPAARGRGLGEHVTATLTRQLLAAGAPVVALGMYSDNDVARRIYFRLGFRCDHRWSTFAVTRTPG